MGTALGELAWPQVAARTLAIPVGACEQHGPHLPMDTDTRIAVAVAERLAEVREDVLVAPAVAYGASGEHQAFAGTVSAGHEGLRALLVELIRSATLTFARIVIVNAHGGNVETLARTVDQQRGEGRDLRVWHVELGDPEHAGRAETSVMLALAPHLVDAGLPAAGVTAPVAELLPRLRAEGVRAVTANGVLGDPTGATAEEGDALLARAAERLVAMVDAW